jgi:hypothetical protein
MAVAENVLRRWSSSASVRRANMSLPRRVLEGAVKLMQLSLRETRGDSGLVAQGVVRIAGGEVARIVDLRGLVERIQRGTHLPGVRRSDADQPVHRRRSGWCRRCRTRGR